MATNEPIIENAFMTLAYINAFFADNPKKKIGKEDFMEFQRLVWLSVKKKYGIKV